MIFVVATVPPHSSDEIGLVIVSPSGELLRSKRVDLDGVARFLHEWLAVPSIQVVFVCALLSGMNTTIMRRHLEELGYYNVSFNGMAYCSLTNDQLIDKSDLEMEEIAGFFADHLAIDTPGVSYFPIYQTNVYVTLTYDTKCGFTIAAGTIYHGVQLAQRLHYNADICETLIPWLSKPLLYRLILVCNYLSIDAIEAVNKVIDHHCQSLDNLYRVEMTLATANFRRFCREESRKPNYNFARAVLEEFIVQKRLQH